MNTLDQFDTHRFLFFPHSGVYTVQVDGWTKRCQYPEFLLIPIPPQFTGRFLADPEIKRTQSVGVYLPLGFNWNELITMLTTPCLDITERFDPHGL